MMKQSNIIKERIQGGAGFPDKQINFLTILLLIWTFCGCMIPNIWLSLVDNMAFLPAVTNIVLPAGIYLFLLSLTRKIGITALVAVILYLFSAFQMVLLYMYGRSIIAVDMFLNVVTTNSGEVGELLGNISGIILTIIAIYLPPLVIGVVACVRKYRLSVEMKAAVRRTSVITMAMGVMLLICCHIFNGPKFRTYLDIYPFNVFYNLREAFVRTAKTASYQKNVTDMEYPAESSRADSLPETYVIVIGETSRGDNWEINGYSRPTTPRLMDVDGLVSYPNTVSQSNTTHKSVPMLLSHLDADSYGDSIYHVKSLITAFRNSGYKTAFFSSQSRNRSFIDFFGEEADSSHFIRESMPVNAKVYDRDLLSYLDDILASTCKKKLIVLHTHGSHFNYADRYPDDEARFLPDGPIDGSRDSRDILINAYDNSILYTSNFLADIIERLKGIEGIKAMIYTSDHGEDIFDDDRNLFTHASPVPSYWQLRVPFLVWTGESDIIDFEEKKASLQANRERFVASNDALYHTVIDMAGIKTPFVKYTSSLASRDYAPKTARYLNDHDKSVSLRENGMLKQDHVKLDSLGIHY